MGIILRKKIKRSSGLLSVHPRLPGSELEEDVAIGETLLEPWWATFQRQTGQEGFWNEFDHGRGEVKWKESK